MRANTYGGFPLHLPRLRGLFADSLPDGLGLLLVGRLLRQQGRPLDRLAFIGDRAMGALRFVPATEPDVEEPDWNLLALAKESERALAGEVEVVLHEFALTGASRKALVQYDAGS